MVQVFVDGVGSEALIAALELLYYGKCELSDVSEDEVREAVNVLGFHVAPQVHSYIQSFLSLSFCQYFIFPGGRKPLRV